MYEGSFLEGRCHLLDEEALGIEGEGVLDGVAGFRLVAMFCEGLGEPDPGFVL